MCLCLCNWFVLESDGHVFFAIILSLRCWPSEQDLICGLQGFEMEDLHSLGFVSQESSEDLDHHLSSLIRLIPGCRS
jgi:hypothetical protein